MFFIFFSTADAFAAFRRVESGMGGPHRAIAAFRQNDRELDWCGALGWHDRLASGNQKLPILVAQIRQKNHLQFLISSGKTQENRHF